MHTTFHDLNVTVVDGIYKHKLCDMKDKHPFFFIFHTPDQTGNIPVCFLWLNSIGVFRIVKCTLKLSNFFQKLNSRLKE